MPASINDNEAQTVDLKVISALESIGWKVGDSLLYQPEYQLTEEQQQQYAYDGKPRKRIKPDIVLMDPISHDVLAVFENKLKHEKKALSKLRMLYAQILKPRFLYACSKARILFYDTAWSGLDAGEFRRTDEFLTLEQMKMKLEQQKKINQDAEIRIDIHIAGGYDQNIGKDRYYQLDCINTLIRNYKAGEMKMLVHMATGLGKTRTTVALVKALLSHGLAKKILFIVDRRMLAQQALDDGFSLISKEHTSARIRTTNFRQQKHAAIHVVVIDTLERIFTDIPGTYYDLIIVDECHRSISVNRKLIFDHFLCPRIGLTATPKIAISKRGSHISPEDLAIFDTYKLFGCETDEPTYKFDMTRGIDEGFLAQYKVTEILTHLTKEAEDEGIEFEYVLDPNTRERIDLPKEKKLKLEQLERKYLTEERCKRIAEEIRRNISPCEKMILFGVSQVHCQIMAKELNKVYHDDTVDGVRYAEPVISENHELNQFLKTRFKRFNQKPYITLSVDIMSTGVDIPCLRYIGFAALTQSVGKYIQMVGRGTRLDPKTGKFSFQILDFVGLCQKMDDNRKGTLKPNVKAIGPSDMGGGSAGEPRGEYFIVDKSDPGSMIQRVCIHGDDVRVVDNIPIEEAIKIFEREAKSPKIADIQLIQEKVKASPDYEPTEAEIAMIDEWLKAPDIYLDEGQLQKMYDYSGGANWDFLLHALDIKKIPTSKERIEKGFEIFISKTEDLNDDQLTVLFKMKDIFASNLYSRQEITLDTIFANPVYERVIGKREHIETIFSGRFNDVADELKKNLRLPVSL